MKDWHPEDVKSSLRKFGYSQADIARELDVTPSFVSHVIHGIKNSRIQAQIAEKLDKKPEEIWPSRYPRLTKMAA